MVRGGHYQRYGPPRASQPTLPNAAKALDGKHLAIDGRYLSRPGMGIHTYLVGVIDSLRAAGIQLSVLTNPGHPVPEDFGLDVIEFGGTTQVIWEQFHVPRHLRSRRYDAYWAPANGGVGLLVPLHQKYIVTVHDLIPLLLPKSWFPRQILWGIAYFVSLSTALLRSSVVIAPSNYSAEVIRKYSGRRALVIPPAIPPRRTNSRTQAMMDGQKYVLYHGGTGPRKRVDSVLRACAVLRDLNMTVQFVLLGRGYDDLDQEIDRLQIGQLVHRPGYVSDADRDAWVDDATVVVYPSEMEGFGLPVLEAMSAGVPVVTSLNSSLAEVGAGVAAFAPPDDPAQIASRIAELMSGRARAEAVSAGKKRASEYSIAHLHDSVADMLIETIG